MSRIKLAWQYAKAAGRIMAGGYDAARSDRNRGDMPWGSAVSQDEDHFVTGYDRETIRQKLLNMRRNVPLVKGMCDRMCDFVVGPSGLQVQALTDDAGWNKAAEQWFDSWCRTCDVTGRIPFRRIQRGLVDARLWAGESFILFTDDGHLQAIEAERVRQPFGVPETATQYDGMRLSGPRVTHWYIADRDDQGTFMKPLGRWVEAERVYHYGSPWRFDSIRALPELAAAVNVITDIGEISLFTLIQMKKQAQIAGVSNTEGATDLLASRGSGSKGAVTQNGISAHKLDGAGLILRGLQGETLTLASPATPNPNLEGHLVFNIRTACSTIGLPYEVAMMDSTRGNLSQNKAIRELFSRVVDTWQLDGTDFVKYAWCYALPFAWKSGAITKPPVDKNGRSQWDRIDVQPPPATWADPQDAAETDAKNLLLGKITHGSVIRRTGGNRPDVWKQRAKEEQERLALAKEYGIDPDKIASVQMSGSAPSGKPAAAGKGTDETDK